KADPRNIDDVARLTAEVESLRARLDTLEAGGRHNGNGNGNGSPRQAPQSRRDLLKLAGAAAAGAAGTIVLNAMPAAATNSAPIQGVGGTATITTTTGAKPVSEGVNGYGFGPTGIGTTGESDIGYGVVGGSGGIDIAALGNGRILQLALPNAMLTAAPKGPPNYAPNDYENTRDGNGLVYVSLAGGAWVPLQFGGLNKAIFTAATTKLLALK